MGRPPHSSGRGFSSFGSVARDVAVGVKKARTGETTKILDLLTDVPLREGSLPEAFRGGDLRRAVTAASEGQEFPRSRMRIVDFLTWESAGDRT